MVPLCSIVVVKAGEPQRPHRPPRSPLVGEPVKEVSERCLLENPPIRRTLPRPRTSSVVAEGVDVCAALAWARV